MEKGFTEARELLKVLLSEVLWISYNAKASNYLQINIYIYT